MNGLLLVALLSAVAVSVDAQPTSSAVAIQPSVDTPVEQQALRSLSMCLAQARPRWARGVLEHPYLSEAQASAAAQAVSGRDHCQQRNEVEMTFRTSTLVSAMAEYYLRSDLPKTDTLRLNKALASLPARNASEDFGLCVASHAPAAARALALSEPGSSTEASSAQEMQEAVATCTAHGEALKVDLQSLRALVTIALYRGVVATLGA